MQLHDSFRNVSANSLRLSFEMKFFVFQFVLQVWEKSGYNTVEWVRYITKAGSYEIRC